MTGLKYLENVATLKLDKDKCNGCGMCINVCPHNVFSMNGKSAEILNLNSCMECGACELNCQAAAIKVDSGVGCAAAVINSMFSKSGEVICGCDDDSGSQTCC